MSNRISVEKQIPTGAIKQFGQFGVPYIVGDFAEEMANGDILVNITLLETGEQDLYTLSGILNDPEAE